MTVRKNNPNLVAAVLFCFGALRINAQVMPNNAALVTALAADSMVKQAPYHPFTISPEAGLTGIGATLGWRFQDHLGVRAGMDYFSYNQSIRVEDIKYKLKFRLESEPVALDLFPFRKSSLHVSLGALINQNEFSGANNSDGTIKVNGNDYDVTAGDVSLKIKQQSVLPYASLGGSIYLDRSHQWSVGGELGVAYGRWDALLKSKSGIISDEDIAAEDRKVKNALNKYPLWPILKLNIGYSF